MAAATSFDRRLIGLFGDRSASHAGYGNDRKDGERISLYLLGLDAFIKIRYVYFGCGGMARNAFVIPSIYAEL